jgi:hypothetical protein
VGLVDLGISLALLAGQEYKFNPGLGVFDYLPLGREAAPDLGGSGHGGQYGQSGAYGQFCGYSHKANGIVWYKYTKKGQPFRCVLDGGGEKMSPRQSVAQTKSFNPTKS